MTYLFTRANLSLLKAVARSDVLAAFDYDGTLAPIVAKPAQAAMRPSTRRLLSQVAARYPCVIISGRARGDALQRLRGVDLKRVIGNHGAEPSHLGAATRRRVQRWLPTLKARLAGWQGVVIEDKGLSLAIHYRHAQSKSAARRAILSAARSLDTVRTIGGKLAINLLVSGGPHKGLAVQRERARLGCANVIYVGDDDTDEDVFQLDRSGWLFSILVGSRRSSAASYFIRGQHEIDRLLRALVELRGGNDD